MNVILAFDELRPIAIIFSRPQHASFTDSDQADLALKQKHQWEAQLEERPSTWECVDGVMVYPQMAYCTHSMAMKS